MVQQPRQDEPLYSCVVPLEYITGNQEEELITFGSSAEAAKTQAKQLLVDNYGCHEAEINQLIQRSRLEMLSPWCSPNQSESLEN